MKRVVWNFIVSRVMISKEIEIFYRDIKERKEWSFQEISRSETSELTHSYHKYPAKFIPQLAKALLCSYSNYGDLVWDPFCGSGTLNVEAFRNNRHSIGTDINPTAILITRAKSKPLEPINIKEYCDGLIELIKSSRLRSQDYYTEQGVLNGNIPILKKWYSSYNLRQLGQILFAIQQSHTCKNNREFALCAFSSILKRSSFWLNSSIKGQIDPLKVPGKPINYLKKQLNFMHSRNDEYYRENKNNTAKVRIIKHNVKHKLTQTVRPIDCIITSPPYLVSYDYSDIFRLSTYFLFYQENYSSFRKSFIGTSLKKNVDKNQIEALPSICQSVVKSINVKAIQQIVFTYFLDMEEYLRKMKEGLKPNGRMILIIGDTALRGISIPNTYIIAKLATRNGWTIEDVYSREIPAKILPTIRDSKTGKFTRLANKKKLNRYSKEYILVLRRSGR